MKWLLKSESIFDLLHLPIQSWWGMLAAAVCLVVVVWAVVRLVARVNEGIDPAEADREMLMTMTELHRQGDLSKDEFRSIKGQLVERLSDAEGITRKQAETAGPSAGTSDPKFAATSQPETVRPGTMTRTPSSADNTEAATQAERTDDEPDTNTSG